MWKRKQVPEDEEVDGKLKQRKGGNGRKNYEHER